MINKKKREQEGYILVGVLLLVGLAAAVIATALESSSSHARTIQSIKVRSENYYDAERSLNMGISWFRDNSTSLALMFSRANFYTLFDRTNPSNGDNDGSLFTVPTKVKLQASNNSGILASSTEVATSAFPNTTDAVTGNAFVPTSGFTSSDFGDSQLRVTLVDVVPIDASKDYGDPDAGNPSPDTDFYPVYRVDSLNDTSSGAHVFSYLVGSLVLDYGIGFYGRDSLEMRQDCDSYLSNDGAYSNASKRANCTAGSNGALQIHQNEILYGAARTNGAIVTSNPYGGQICADFTTGCPNPGTTCQGANCAVPGLPTYSSWATYCPSNQGNITINPSQTLTVPGNLASQKCWDTITIGNNKVLTLTTTDYSYFIEEFNIPNNSRINFSPSPGTGTINLYVTKFAGDNFNGNQVYNTNNKPYQLRIHYLGTDALTLNGTAAMNAFIIAPYAAVNVQGNFTFAGGIKATSLAVTGSGQLHYDESGDITTISDTSYQIKSVGEYYR